MNDRLAHELGRARVPVAVLQRGLQLQHAHRQQGEQGHQREADVERPECPGQHTVVPLRFGLEPAQAEQHQADPEHAVDAEQRRVTVQRRQVEALHVVERHRRVDEKPEQAGADQVPETDREEEQDRPSVALHPRHGLAMPPGFMGLEPDQRQRHHFESRDARAERDHRRGGAGKIQVMEGAEDATGHEHDGGEQHVDRCRLRAHQAEFHEQEADDGHREHLEEALDPEVHHPPAPVFDHRQMRVLVPHQSGAEQQTDGRGGQEQQADDG